MRRPPSPSSYRDPRQRSKYFQIAEIPVLLRKSIRKVSETADQTTVLTLDLFENIENIENAPI